VSRAAVSTRRVVGWAVLALVAALAWAGYRIVWGKPFTINMLANVPFTADLSAWYMPTSTLALLSVVALAGWGFYQSLGGEALWRPEIE